MSNKYAKYRGNEYIYPHKHCPVCNKIIPEDEEYCSIECATFYKNKDKSEKRKIYLFIGIYLIAIVAFVIFIINSSRSAA